MHFVSWVTARFDVLFKMITLQRRYFSCTFPFFEKATNLFNAAGHHACSSTPTKIYTDILLPAPKTFGLKIVVACFTNWFQSIFTVGGWRMYLFNLPMLAPAYIPTQSCKKASFRNLNPVRVRSYKLEPGSSPFIFEARFRPESQIYRGS